MKRSSAMKSLVQDSELFGIDHNNANDTIKNNSKSDVARLNLAKNQTFVDSFRINNNRSVIIQHPIHPKVKIVKKKRKPFLQECRGYSCLKMEFPTLLEIRDLCGNDSVDLVALVTSSPADWPRRNAVRETWAAFSKQNTANVRYVFILGVDNVTNSHVIERESRIRRDIIQFQFNDTYRNLTYKTITGLRWISRNCPQAKYIIKTDADVWINMPVLLNLLFFDNVGDVNKMNSSFYGYDNETYKWHLNNAIGGFCLKDVYAERHPDSLYKVMRQEYPYLKYPPFCSGTGYVMKMDTVNAILKVTTKVAFLYLEDIYIHLCLEKIGGHTVDIPGFKLRGFQYTCQNRTTIITLHPLKIHKMKFIANMEC